MSHLVIHCPKLYVIILPANWQVSSAKCHLPNVKIIQIGAPVRNIGTLEFGNTIISTMKK